MSNPIRSYVYFGGDQIDNIRVALKHVLPSDYAPHGTWDNLYKKVTTAHEKRPNTFTIDGLRALHLVLAYGKYKPGDSRNIATRAPSKEHWNNTRREVMRWAEDSIHEVMRSAVK